MIKQTKIALCQLLDAITEDITVTQQMKESKTEFTEVERILIFRYSEEIITIPKMFKGLIEDYPSC